MEEDIRESPQTILASMRFPSPEEIKLMDYDEVHSIWEANHEKLLQVVEENEVPYFGISGSTCPDSKKLLNKDLYFVATAAHEDPGKTLATLMLMAKYISNYTTKGQPSTDLRPGCIVLINLTSEKGNYIGSDQQQLNDCTPFFDKLKGDKPHHRDLWDPAHQTGARITYETLLDPERIKRGKLPTFMGAIAGDLLKDYMQPLTQPSRDMGKVFMVLRLLYQRIVGECLKQVLSNPQ